MPIFHDPKTKIGRFSKNGLFLHQSPMHRKQSDESIRTEFCEGPVLFHEALNDDTIPPPLDSGPPVSDRQELIDRIKRGESPTWVPNKNLEALVQSLNNPPTLPSRITSPTAEKNSKCKLRRTPTPPIDTLVEPLASPADIERPRSALHAGDFRDEQARQPPQNIFPSFNTRFGASHSLQSSPWDESYPHILPEVATAASVPSHPQTHTPHSQAPSLSSYSSSFVLKPPTSPLAYASYTDENDLSPTVEGFNLNSVSNRCSRRHTLPHNLTIDRTASGSIVVPNYSKPLPLPKKEHNFPYQAHQPRKSLTTQFDSHRASLTTPNVSRARRPSLSSDFSPLHHAPMVGSYEESILRGRMSTAPSKPLDFMAQIGVLGFGQCRSSLKCPAHISVPFPAVFYSYSTSISARRTTDDDPSPYVGLIDLENCLALDEDSKAEKRRRRQRSLSADETAGDIGVNIPDGSLEALGPQRRRREKQSRRGSQRRSPPGGSYRIPQKGQLQIIIKNPNKTAVKLFLVPYDLEDMEPGTKTFVRQRSYSTGPIMDLPVSKLAVNDRPSLRYLIHLHICCTSRGRYFLYKSIRVVFANRVPDGKENLRNEVQLQEPRYSPYRPGREATGSVPASVDRSLYRRSAGSPSILQARAAETFGIPPFPNPYVAISRSHQPTSRPLIPIRPIPFPFIAASEPRPSQTVPLPTEMDVDPPVPPSPSTSAPSSSQHPSSLRSPPRPLTASSDISLSDAQVLTGREADKSGYDKLSRGNAGYGGFGFWGPEYAAGEGLLAQRLKGLDVEASRRTE
ncbi:MAG: hypothetical protein M1814_003439 [Vezdaea aestivalis]|nr:MAG: hypothetical protein M1814_003439 [Vezdaea aestivalis]